MSDLINEQGGYVCDFNYECDEHDENKKTTKRNETKQSDLALEYLKIENFVWEQQRLHGYSDKWRKGKFCDLRNELHATRAKNFKVEREMLMSKINEKECVVACKCCGSAFVAKKADRKRGWGKFCSKSCKAQRQ